MIIDLDCLTFLRYFQNNFFLLNVDGLSPFFLCSGRRRCSVLLCLASFKEYNTLLPESQLETASVPHRCVHTVVIPAAYLVTEWRSPLENERHSEDYDKFKPFLQFPACIWLRDKKVITFNRHLKIPPKFAFYIGKKKSFSRNEYISQMKT